MKKLPKIVKLKGIGTGSYSWDNGCVAFGDPMEHSKKVEEHRKRETLRWRETKKSKGDLSNKQNFHLKHG
jgi:hypothetical protein